MEQSGKLPRRRRLNLKREFDAVFASGKTAADGNLVVYVMHTDKGLARLGMAVGKKLGGAVARNRIKRLIREAFRLNLGELPGSADIVVIPRQNTKLTLAEVAESMVNVSRQAAGEVE